MYYCAGNSYHLKKGTTFSCARAERSCILRLLKSARKEWNMLTPMTEIIEERFADQNSLTIYADERRSHPRVQIRFPATVKGVDANGKAFETETLLKDLSVNGLFLKLEQQVSEGVEVWVTIQLALGPTTGLRVPRVVVRGFTKRAEPQPDGKTGLAVSITHHKFL